MDWEGDCTIEWIVYSALVNYLCTFVSQWQTVALSIDRWIAVHKALNYHTIMSPRRLKILIASSWTLAFVEALGFSVMEFFVECFSKDRVLRRAIYVLPSLHLVIIFLINAVIYGTLWTAARRQRRQIAQLQQQQDNTPAVNKATIMVMVIVALFGLLWLPVVVIRFWELIIADSISSEFDIVEEIAVPLGSSYSLINCIVYVFFNKNLRGLLSRKLKCR